jgi:hypothetical protein
MLQIPIKFGWNTIHFGDQNKYKLIFKLEESSKNITGLAGGYVSNLIVTDKQILKANANGALAILVEYVANRWLKRTKEKEVLEMVSAVELKVKRYLEQKTKK